MAILRSVFATAVIVAFVGLGARLSTGPAYGASEQTYVQTPPFVKVGKRYAFTWSGGGPSQTYTVKLIRHDGWILVDVVDETVNPAYLIPADQLPTRWLNVAAAISIQEMRPFVQ